jgi:iron complex transport system ATP-binding protein
MDKATTSRTRILIENLTVGYGQAGMRNILFQDLNLEIHAGELVCFMGSNGVGKSTLIRTLAGLQLPFSGRITYNGHLGNSEITLPQQIAVVLTDKITATNMTVFEVVSYGRYPYLSWNVNLAEKDINLIEYALEEVHVSHLKEKRLYELSDGQMQMVMIARAVVQDTPIILLDEPTAHLDLNNRLEIMNLLRKLAHQSNKAILVATHELDLALQTADLIWLAGLKKNIIRGIPEDLVLNGSFDSIFQFKGYDLKTGKIQHDPHRGVHIRLSGTSPEYLWTKNALERYGFIVVDDNTGKYNLHIEKEKSLRWLLDESRYFNSLQDLLDELSREF